MLCPICKKNRLVFHVGNGEVQGVQEIPPDDFLFKRFFKPCRTYQRGTEIFQLLVNEYEAEQSYHEGRQAALKQHQANLAKLDYTFRLYSDANWHKINEYLEIERQTSQNSPQDHF